MAKTSEPPAWLTLFDTGEAGHVCEQVRADIVGVSHGVPSGMYVPLRRFLVAPLDAYIADHWRPGMHMDHVEAASRLREAAEDLAQMFEDRYPFDEDAAERKASELWSAWLEFAAKGSAHRMYHDLPREIERAVTDRAQKAGAAKRSAEVRSVRGWLAHLSIDDVVEVMSAVDAPTKYEAVISALCDRARLAAEAAARKGQPVPRKGSSPGTAAKRRYREAVSAGRVKAVSQRR